MSEGIHHAPSKEDSRRVVGLSGIAEKRSAGGKQSKEVEPLNVAGCRYVVKRGQLDVVHSLEGLLRLVGKEAIVQHDGHDHDAT